MDYPAKASILMARHTPSQIIKPQFKTNNPDQLDQSFYVKAYKDVNPRFTNPIQHYYNIGIHEDRLPNANKFHELYPLVNIVIYASKNADLAYFTQEELMGHFHHSGRFECRIYR